MINIVLAPASENLHIFCPPEWAEKYNATFFNHSVVGFCQNNLSATSSLKKHWGSMYIVQVNKLYSYIIFVSVIPECSHHHDSLGYFLHTQLRRLHRNHVSSCTVHLYCTIVFIFNFWTYDTHIMALMKENRVFFRTNSDLWLLSI